ncbi:MAG: hypothetical protein JJT94_08090 [Bernardetiaceae bacterium]|nr:hypothetical protein [Bernardetiaceae bacterium]
MLGNFVFDIDDTLAVAQSDYNHKELEPKIRKQFGDEFFERHCLMVNKYPHYIFPGFYALFRWLHEKGGKIFFFSSGLDVRNIPFAELMMEKAFGANPPEYKVFSREDCIDTSYKSDEFKALYQSYFYGQRKKKLGGIVVPEEEVPNSILIEDDQSYMTKGEEYNLVRVGGGFSYLPTPASREKAKDEKDYQQDLFSNMALFHKAFYLTGLFSKIFEVRATKNCTLVEATREVQMEGHVLAKGNVWFPSLRRLKYYLDGQKILNQIDPSLVFLFEAPEGDNEY